MVLVLTDNSWPGSSLPATFHPFKYSIVLLKHMSATAPCADSFFLSLLSHLPLNYWALPFKGTRSSHQMCRPSGLLHRSFTRGWSLPHVAIMALRKSLTCPSLTSHFNTCSLTIFFQALTLLTFSLNNSLLPSHFLYLFFAVLLSFFLPNPDSFPLLFCFSLMSRPTAGCHWVDGEKIKENWVMGRVWQECMCVLVCVCVCFAQESIVWRSSLAQPYGLRLCCVGENTHNSRCTTALKPPCSLLGSSGCVSPEVMLLLSLFSFYLFICHLEMCTPPGTHLYIEQKYKISHDAVSHVYASVTSSLELRRKIGFTPKIEGAACLHSPSTEGNPKDPF